jgi:hypothetical protein
MDAPGRLDIFVERPATNGTKGHVVQATAVRLASHSHMLLEVTRFEPAARSGHAMESNRWAFSSRVFLPGALPDLFQFLIDLISQRF